MFQKINDRINFSFDSEIPKGKDEILTLLRQKAIAQNTFSFYLSGQIDFKEITFLDNRIEIIRRPGTLSTFRPFGKVMMTFIEARPNRTKVRCNVMPWNNSVPALFIIQNVTVIIWALVWVLSAWRLELSSRYLTPIGIIAISNVILFLKYKSDRQRLIEYSKAVIKLMLEEKPAFSKSENNLVTMGWTNAPEN